jgi:tetraacyldisaccharide 4'-kinase
MGKGIIKALYPLSWIYAGVTLLRNKLFDCGMLRSESFDVPTICVGNLSVGGTGKTPHTEYLINLLSRDHRVAVLSRGYKRRTKGYVLADDTSDAHTIGDEPYQMKCKYPGVTVAVDEDRCHGAARLLSLPQPPQVILLDDAYQHRYIKAGLYILLTDYHRLFCDDTTLPAGRLREPSSGKRRARIVIVTKCPPDLSADECRRIAGKLKLNPDQELYFSCFGYAPLQPIERGDTAIKPIVHSELSTTDVLLVTGIASPRPLVEAISRHAHSVATMTFADHHDFSPEDMAAMVRRFSEIESGNKIIVTTEKDATRIICHNSLIDSLKERIFVQPIEVKFLQKQEEIFNQHITGYVTENSRDSSVSEGAHAHQS